MNERGAWILGFGLAIGCAEENTAPVSTQASLVGDWNPVRGRSVFPAGR
jgi:hypothetical protein